MSSEYETTERRSGKNNKLIASAEVEIKNKLGFHARPCALFVQLASQYKDCDVRVTKDSVTVDGKSIMGLIMLAAPKGSRLRIEVEGERCRELLEGLVGLFEKKFDEE